MSAEIKSLRGAVPHTEPVPAVVETLTRLLERAQSGEIQGIAYAATMRPGDGFSSGWDGNAGHHHQLGTAVSHLFHRFYRSFDE